MKDLINEMMKEGGNDNDYRRAILVPPATETTKEEEEEEELQPLGLVQEQGTRFKWEGKGIIDEDDKISIPFATNDWSD